MSELWTMEEEKFLKDNYLTLSIHELQKGLLKINGMRYGRTKNSIRSKVKSLNLEHKQNTTTFNGVYPYKTLLTKIDCDNNYIYKDIK